MKKSRVLLSIFIIIILNLIFFNNVGRAETYKIYENLQYTVRDDDNTVTINRLLNRTTVTEVIIPKEIEGKKVTALVGSFATPTQGEVTALKKITIPSTVETIGSDYYGPFENASKLEEIIIDSESKHFCSVDGVLYNKDKTELIAYPANKKGSTYTIPNTVTEIRTLAFAFAKNLETINIPNTVNKIGRSCFAQSSIKSLTIPESVEGITESYLCYKCPNLETVIFNADTGIGYNCFDGCSNLKTITIGDKCTGIFSEAFKDCTKLTNINLETSKIAAINKGAFKNCTSLPKTLKIPEKMISLTKSAFDSDIKFQFNGNYIETTDSWEKCVDISVNGIQDYEEAYKVFELTNEERKKQGLPELKLDKTLTDIAMQRAYEISIYYAHRRIEVYRGFALGAPEYDAKIFFKDTFYRMKLKDTNQMLAENIAYGQTSSQGAVDSWMNSTGHRANILHKDLKTIGIGAVKVNNRYFWVQFFGDDTEGITEKKRENKTEIRQIPVSSVYMNSSDKQYSGITLEPTDTFIKYNKSMYVGRTTEINVRARMLYSEATTYIDAANFKWSSSNEKVITVDQQGNIKAISTGEADIIITMQDGSTKSINLKVNDIAITSISLNKTRLDLEKGKTESLTATINPSNATNKVLEWTSNNKAIATVDNNGKVTAVSAGTTVITAKAKDGSGKISSCTVTVTNPDVIKLGDVNKDGIIDVFDARVILRKAASRQEFSEYEKQAGDVNKDGKVNVLDARKILMYSAKIITEF